MKIFISDNLPVIIWALVLFSCIFILALLESQKNEIELQCKLKGGIAIKTISNNYECIKADRI